MNPPKINSHIGTAGFVIEGLYNWIFAMGGSPHICIVADWEGNQLPADLPVQTQQIANDDDDRIIELPTIILNIGDKATRGLTFYRGKESKSTHDPVTHLLFSARSNGVHFDATIDVNSILSAFMLEESGRGMSLGNNSALEEYVSKLVSGTSAEAPVPVAPKPTGRPTLSVVK